MKQKSAALYLLIFKPQPR